MRKFISLTLTLGLMITFSFAQFTQGTKSAGGSLSWASTTFDGEAMSTTLSIAPSISYFAIDNLSASFNLNMNTFTPEGGDGETSTSFGLGAKYYMNGIYGGGSYNSSTPPGDDAEASATLIIELGYLYGLSDNVYLDAGFDYHMGMGDNKMGGMMLGLGVATFF